MAYNKASLQFGNIADINSGHALVMPEVDPIIRSVLLKTQSPFAKRIKHKPESHETFRWVEESGLNRSAAFIDPRNITSTANTGITRVEKMAKLKGMSNRINYGLFDTELTKNGMFSYVLQDDMENMINDMMLLENDNMWTGNDTSYSSSTTNQYFGVLSAITNTASIPLKTASSPTMAQAIKTQVAKMSARTDVDTLPTAIYMNPLTLDALEIEENAQTDKTKFYDVEVVPGTTVKAIMTVAGKLPIITDNRIPVDTSGGTNDLHKIILVDEAKIVRHHLIGYENPVVFKMGEVQSLLTEYVAVQFANVVVQFPDKSHCVMTKTLAK